MIPFWIYWAVVGCAACLALVRIRAHPRYPLYLLLLGTFVGEAAIIAMLLEFRNKDLIFLHPATSFLLVVGLWMLGSEALNRWRGRRPAAE